MDLVSLSPYVRLAHEYTVQDGYFMPERVIYDYELMFFRRGGARICLEGVDYECAERDLFLIKPRESHTILYHGSECCTHLAMHFDLFMREDSADLPISTRSNATIRESDIALFREDVLSGAQDFVPNLLHTGNTTLIEGLFYSLIDEIRSKAIFYEHACRAIFMRIWVQLMRELYFENGHIIVTNWKKLNAIRERIQNNPTEALPVEEMARLCSFNTSYFIAMFKTFFGATPGRYQHMMRMEHAKRLLRYTDRPITEIAELSGFKSIHAFCSTFKKDGGLTPSQFRKTFQTSATDEAVAH